MTFLRQNILAEGKGNLNLGSTLFSNTQRNLGVEIPFYLEILTLKTPRKDASEKYCLLKSSAANNCPT